MTRTLVPLVITLATAAGSAQQAEPARRQAADKRGAERFDWMPAETSGAALRAEDIGGERIIPEIVLTKILKPTADASKFTRVLEIDLKKFGIRNDGTRPVETSTGINQALQEAKRSGANRIVFPAGTYLISETIPVVIDHKDTVIDLNGAT